MPLSLAALTAITTHATLTIDGESLEVDWYPKRYTTAMMRRVTALDDLFKHVDDLTPEQAFDALDIAADLLAQLVKRWDFYESIAEDGTPGPAIAITQERLRECSLEVLWAILSALLGETRLGESSGTTPKARSHASSSTATRAGSRR